MTAIPSQRENAIAAPLCAAAPHGKHVPHWREWRVAEREGRTIPCQHCGITIWPVCSTCGQARVGWETHDGC